jgi:hypothetical protein
MIRVPMRAHLVVEQRESESSIPAQWSASRRRAGDAQPVGQLGRVRASASATSPRAKARQIGSTSEIVWRTMTSPLWQHSLAVGNRTRVTRPLSKDDFIFGVRAADSKANRSPAVYPAPVF